MMPAKMMSDIPLPMPRSVICSPSHMMNVVPVHSVSTVMNRKNQPGFMTRWKPLGDELRSRKIAMPSDWTRLSAIVPYRVYWVILRRPSSPSFDRRSR